jgi:hypothetical protein
LKELEKMSDVSEIELQRERAGKNQSLFREVNERIEDLSASSSFSMFVCECMDDTCDARVSLTIEEYEHVRAESNSFFVLPGHEVPNVERVIEANDRFLVVAKLGAGARVAEEFDPRSAVDARHGPRK